MRFACAWPTAARPEHESQRASRTTSLRSQNVDAARRRRTRARDTAGRGRDAGVEQARDARVREAREHVPSRRKRSCPPRASSARLSSFTAASPSNRPSVRRASHTSPYRPARAALERVGAEHASGERSVDGFGHEAVAVGHRFAREDRRSTSSTGIPFP